MPIVSDAAIAQRGVAEGRVIPLVILDTTDRPDIERMVAHHSILPPGDVVVQWAAIEDPKSSVALIVQFIRPAELTFVLDFAIAGQGMIVDLILEAGGLLLQPGRPGDRLMHNTEAPRILIEIPKTGFEKTWEKLYLKAITRRMRDEGLRRRRAKAAAREFLDTVRAFGQIRVRSSR